MSLRLPALAALAAALLSVPARAAIEGEGTSKSKSIRAVRAATPPLIDGDLGDAVWAGAPVDDRFTQHFPDDGQPPTQRTEVRILYDDAAVYVGVRLHDSAAGEIVARLTRRDRLVESDYVIISIDSRHDHGSGYQFRLNAAGVQADALLFNDNNTSYEWDAVWDGSTSRDAGGWSAEFRIPLSVLRFTSPDEEDEQEWGLNVRRYISRRQEVDLWTYRPRTASGEASRMGHITGLRGLRPRRTFELRPFVVSHVRAFTASGGALLGLQRHGRYTSDATVGLDAKLGITSDLTLDLTVNPDFGQVEADQVVLNLSRFETFFPEKRPFFLEGMDVFTTPIQMFYSRRIGRPPSGKVPGSGAVAPDDQVYEVVEAPAALPIYTAAKLSGKALGNLTIGTLAAVTSSETVRVRKDAAGTEEELRLAPTRGYSVARLRYDFGGNSYVGLMATALVRLGDELTRASANHDAWAEGLDAQWQAKNGVWRIQGQGVVSHRIGGTALVTDLGTPCHEPAARPCTPITRPDGTRLEPGDVGYGTFLGVYYRGAKLISEAYHRLFSPKFDVNDVGFQPRFNMHDLEAWAGYQDASGIGAHRYLFAGPGIHGQHDFDGVPTVLETWLHYEGTYRNFWSINGDLGFAPPGVSFDPFETGDGAYFERPGGLGGGLNMASDSSKKVIVRGGVFGGHSWGVNEWDFGAWGDLTFNVIPTLELNLVPELYWNANARRVYFNDPCRDAADPSQGCTVDTTSRDYRFAELDSGTISLTLRTTYTFSPRLSLQGYAQLFLDQGEFANYYRVHTEGTRPKIHRDDLVADPAFMAGDDDFQDTSLNLNTVLRWELSPGTIMLIVYTRSQEAAYDLAGGRPSFRLSGLNSGPAEDVFLLKLTYFAI